MSQRCERHGTLNCRYATCVIDDRNRGTRIPTQRRSLDYTDPLHPSSIANPVSPLNIATDPYGIYGRVESEDRTPYRDESPTTTTTTTSTSDSSSPSGGSDY